MADVVFGPTYAARGPGEINQDIICGKCGSMVGQDRWTNLDRQEWEYIETILATGMVEKEPSADGIRRFGLRNAARLRGRRLSRRRNHPASAMRPFIVYCPSCNRRLVVDA